jgi:hypothetical protein
MESLNEEREGKLCAFQLQRQLCTAFTPHALLPNEILWTLGAKIKVKNNHASQTLMK